MKLRRIAIRRLAGIASPGFELDGFSDGINIVHGPNASGKSSLARALRALLDAQASAGDAVDLEAEFEDTGGNRWQVVRTGHSLIWSCNGQRSQAPPAPDPRHLAGYILHVEDLLESGDRQDEEMAREIARDLAGGYDFAAARVACKVAIGPRFGQSEAKALGEAESELRTIEERQRSLAREETRLDRSEEELARLEAQATRLPRALRAKEWIGHRKRSRELETKRSDFPSDMDRLSGDEIERLATLQEERDRIKRRCDAAAAEAQAFDRIFRRIGLGEKSPDRAMLARIGARLRLLSQHENALQQARQRECEALAVRDAAGGDLGTPAGMRARIDPETLGEVERGLAAYRALRADLRAIEKERDNRCERLAQSASTDFHAGEAENERESEGEKAARIEGLSVDSELDLQRRLRRASKALLQWMAAAKRPAAALPRFVFALLSLLACIAAVFAASYLIGPGASGFASQAPGWTALAFFLIGAPAGICALLAFDRDPGRAQRERAKAAFAEQRIAGPERWTQESVRDRLESLGEALEAIAERIADARRIEYLEACRRKVEEALIEERKGLEAIACDVHFDPILLDASFERWLRLVDRYARADSECIELRSRCEYHSAQADTVRFEIDAFLAAYEGSPAAPSGPVFSRPEPAPEEAGRSEAEPSPPTSADILQSRLEILQTRINERDDALRAKADAEGRSKEAAATDARCRAGIDALYRQAGLEGEDEAELRRRLEVLDRWDALGEARSETLGAEKSCTSELEGDAELSALAMADDEAAVDRLIAGFEADKVRISSLREEITRIRTLIDQAGQGGALEDARAKCRRRGDALERRFEDAKRAEARAFWLDEIESVHRTDSLPDALRLAQRWFARFTRHRFALEVVAKDRFSARDNADGARRALSELSSATRMQLRLAVRIAWALESEKGRTSLPFFLDEALTTADPERFRIVARSLAEFAAEGRQIFYLTAQAHEASHWQASPASPLSRVSVIDLAARRRLERAVVSPSDIAPPPAPSLPPLPGDDSPEEYAQRLGVSLIDPWRPHSTHPFYLLRHDLPLLRRLLAAGIDHLGALDSLLASGEAAVALGLCERRNLQRLQGAATAWFEAWQVGRGRPVDASALEGSGIVSEVFIERALEILRDAKGDAQRLLEAMGALRNFRKDRLERLRQWLFEQGHLSDDSPLDTSALERRTARALLDHALDTDAESAESAKEREDAIILARSLARSLQAGLIRSS
ncbi:MAG: hypothetical protein ISN28_15905 [Ectothiorhodospiraceae bacterium AqS1]|nr:hypothetical protein [Ectothiorhodospiraceae bacterium AqS1]